MLKLKVSKPTVPKGYWLIVHVINSSNRVNDYFSHTSIEDDEITDKFLEKRINEMIEGLEKKTNEDMNKYHINVHLSFKLSKNPKRREREIIESLVSRKIGERKRRIS